MQKQFEWLYSLWQINSLPEEDESKRFKKALQILRLWNALNLSDSDFNEKNKSLNTKSDMAQASSYSHNMLKVRGKLLGVAIALMQETKNKATKNFEYDLIEAFMNDEIDYDSLFWEPEELIDYRREYEFKWKTWAIYKWVGSPDLNKMNTWTIVDIVNEIKDSEWNEEAKDFIEWIDQNETKIKERFKNKRIAYIGVLKWMVMPDVDNPIIKYIKDQKQ